MKVEAHSTSHAPIFGQRDVLMTRIEGRAVLSSSGSTLEIKAKLDLDTSTWTERFNALKQRNPDMDYGSLYTLASQQFMDEAIDRLEAWQQTQ